VGTGSGQPLGITSAPTGATSAGPTAIALADLLAVWYALDPAYRQANASWQMSPAVAKAVRALTDAAGVLLFPANQPLRIFGAPVIENSAMAGLTASAVSAVCGDFGRGYVIRQVQGTTITVLGERFAEYAQIGVIGAERIDGTLSDPKALVKLVQHA
jgi:HK97 family phage major capsid protein